MDTNKSSMPPQVASPPAGRLAARRSSRPASNRSQPKQNLHRQDRASSNERFNGELSNVICELLKEDSSSRALARRFLWEFFD